MLVVRELRVPGLAPLSFEVPESQALAVSGPSGSGKTRLLRALADLDPGEGEVWWRDARRRSTPAPEWRRRVGLLPAEPRFWHSSVRSHFPDAPEAVDGLDRELAALRLDPEIPGADPQRLSTGERSRLALLRLLLRFPEVLLLDEPSANLDRESRELVIARIHRYRRERRASVVWVSHVEEVVAAADQVLRLPEGALHANAAPRGVAAANES